MQEVIKRNKTVQKYDRQKIYNAIMSCCLDSMKDCDEDDFKLDVEHLTNNVEYIMERDYKNPIYIEDIQDIVEQVLMEYDKYIAKDYILYRSHKSKIRNSELYKVYDTIANVESNEITKENANMDAATPAGMMMKFASLMTKAYTDDCYLSKEARQAVENNYIHVHDEDYYPTKSLTCLQHPLDKILQNGFRAGHGSSRAAKRIETASAIACISMETVQNEMHGGQAIPAFDFYLAPYVRMAFIEELKELEEYDDTDYSDYYNYEIADYVDDMAIIGKYPRPVIKAIKRTQRRVHQSMEAFIHNMNQIHSRGGNQVVFSSINYGTDTSPEGRCIIRELLLSTYQGVGNGETPIFPIQIWKMKSGISYEETDRNYDLFKLSCKVTAKRFFPNFLNLDAPFNQHEKWDINDPERYKYEVATMGCRTRVFENLHGEKTSIGRGNLSFTTVNIVKLALECRNIENYDERLETFYRKLDTYIDVAARQLRTRYNFQRTALKKQFPFLMSGLWIGSEKLKANDMVDKLLLQGTLGIGFIGLAECLIALTGKHHGESESSQKLGLEIITHFKERVDNWKFSENLNYSVLATPAEGLSGKFTKKDKQEFGIIEHITDKDYYTNSNHVPVWYHCSIKHKAEVEAPYHSLTLGGHIFYVELDGDATHNEKAVMQVAKTIHDNQMGYGSINHLRNRCLDCGNENAEKDLKVCPVCGSTHIDTIQRITGYLVGSVDSWNAGKKAELKDRVCHDL